MPPPSAWHEPPKPVQSVMSSRTQVESGQILARVGAVSVCGDGVAPPTQKVGCVIVVGVWWNVVEIVVCLSVLSV